MSFGVAVQQRTSARVTYFRSSVPSGCVLAILSNHSLSPHLTHSLTGNSTSQYIGVGDRHQPLAVTMAPPPTLVPLTQSRIQPAQLQTQAQPLLEAPVQPLQNDDFLRRLSFPTAAETQDVAELARQKFTFGRSTVAPPRQGGRLAAGAQPAQQATGVKQLGTVPGSKDGVDAATTLRGSCVDPRLKFLLGQSPPASATAPASAEQSLTEKTKPAASPLSVPDLDQLWKSRTNSNRDISSGSAIRQVVSLYACACCRDSLTPYLLARTLLAR